MIIYSSKYYTKYNQIVKHYKDLDLNAPGDLYTESHHIIPKSMGGSNHKDNLVRVPARVHFLLHWMLYRIYKTQEMANAWNMMCLRRTGRRIMSKSYEYARLAHSKAMSERVVTAETRIKMSNRIISVETRTKIGATHTGMKRSAETCANISAAKKGKPSAFKGKTHSAESKARMSKSQKGKTLSAEVRAKMSESSKGQFWTAEQKMKASIAMKGIPKSAAHKLNLSIAAKNREKITCPHCNKTGAINNIKGYHFDKCKHINRTSNTL